MQLSCVPLSVVLDDARLTLATPFFSHLACTVLKLPCGDVRCAKKGADTQDAGRWRKAVEAIEAKDSLRKGQNGQKRAE